MRIISGKYRRMTISAPPSGPVRPLADAARQSLFDKLGTAIDGCSFLDLFSGSGAVGLEALSRGANRAVFVEIDARVCEFIRKNVSSLGAESQSTVVRQSVWDFLSSDASLSCSPFGVVFAGPPYTDFGMPEADRLCRLLSAKPWISREGLFVLQRDSTAGREPWLHDFFVSNPLHCVGRTLFEISRPKPLP